LKKVLEERNLYTGNGSGNVVFYSSQVREPGSSRYEKYLRLLD
jgi:hypothetical protein